MHDFEFEGYTHCGRKFEGGNISLIVLELSYQTGDMRRLTQNEGLRALGMLQVGTTQTVVARTMNVSQSVISRLWSRYRATHSVNDRRRSGRPRATTHAQDRFIRTLALRNRVITANQIRARLQADTGVRVSAQTIRNRLHRGHLHARRPRVIPCLRDHHIRARRWDN